MRRTRLVTLLASGLLLTALSLAAQGPQDTRRRIPGQINGSVQFKGGAAVVNSVIVYLESEMGEIIQQTSLVGNARFRFEGLDRAPYVVRAKAPGYRDATNRVDLRLMPTASAVLTLYAEREDTPGAAAGLGSTEPAVTVGTLLVPEGAQQEFAKGEESLTQNALPEALAHFEKAVEIYPEYYQAYLSLGTVYMDQAKWPEAEKALKRSLEINDKFAPGYTALGALYNRQGKASEARPLLERSLELEPNGWQAHFELAQTLLLQNKAGEAEPHLWRAHELEPKFPLVHFLLGKISLGKRDLATARSEFQHFLDVAPGHPLATPVRQKVAELDKALGPKP
jgi:tetratricopeptide (TPR) repeat protein